MIFKLYVLFEFLFTTGYIYFLDYQTDQKLNQWGVIISAPFVGLLILTFITWVYIDFGYIIITKMHEGSSMKFHRYAKGMINFARDISNIKINVIGEENIPKENKFVVYSNHISLKDIIVVMSVLKNKPVAFLAKEVLGNMPFIGKWIRKMGCVLIDRSNDRKGAEAIIQTIRQVKADQPMCIFPEGTRYKTADGLGEFKAGSFKVALKAKAPILPVTIMKDKNELSRKWPRRNHITMVIHPMIPYETLKPLKSNEVAELTKSIIHVPIKERFPETN